LSYTQSFSYDALNRLSSATETNGGTTNWSQTNAYDRYGNRQIDYGGGSYNVSFSSTTNRITTSGFSYDSSGNLTNDTIHAYAFDGNDKIKSVDSTTAYTYDGSGSRVRKLVGENVSFVYGLAGELIMEFDGSSGNLKKEYISGGITIEPTAVNSNGTQYGTADHLGTSRVIANSSGSVISRHDYMPFGEELGASVGGRTTGMGFSNSGDNNRKKFTGYERDNETGLDFAQARYNSNILGRFTSPDPYSGSMSLGDPQSFNRYAYVDNNPLTHTDPTGLSGDGPGGSLPGAEGALGRLTGNNGVFETDWSGNASQHWMMPYGESDYSASEPEAEAATKANRALGGDDGKAAAQETPSQPVSFTGVQLLGSGRDEVITSIGQEKLGQKPKAEGFDPTPPADPYTYYFNVNSSTGPNVCGPVDQRERFKIRVAFSVEEKGWTIDPEEKRHEVYAPSGGSQRFAPAIDPTTGNWYEFNFKKAYVDISLRMKGDQLHNLPIIVKINAIKPGTFLNPGNSGRLSQVKVQLLCR
jgi:RHS repeat-associated protein